MSTQYDAFLHSYTNALLYVYAWPQQGNRFNNKGKRVKLYAKGLAVMGAALLISGCSNVKDDFIKQCRNESMMPQNVCECQYDELKKRSSDKDIKHFLKGEHDKSSLSLNDLMAAGMTCSKGVLEGLFGQ